MAGIQLNPAERLKASTILEVIISMALIMIVFSIAMGIFANVQRLSLSQKQIHAQAVLKEVLLQAEQLPDITKQTLTVEGISITEEITIYNNNSTLHQVVLVAYDGNQEKIGGLKEVVYDAR